MTLVFWRKYLCLHTLFVEVDSAERVWWPDLINEHLLIISCMQRMSQTIGKEAGEKNSEVPSRNLNSVRKRAVHRLFSNLYHQSNSQCPTESIHYERIGCMNEYINVHKEVWYKERRKVKVNTHGCENEETVNSLWNDRLLERVYWWEKFLTWTLKNGFNRWRKKEEVFWQMGR